MSKVFFAAFGVVVAVLLLFVFGRFLGIHIDSAAAFITILVCGFLTILFGFLAKGQEK